jgi:hypothetical protein
MQALLAFGIRRVSRARLCSPHACVGVAALVLAASLVPQTEARAQAPVQIRGPARTVPELWVDGTFGTPSSLHIGGGLQFPAGTYLRVAILGGWGRAWADGERRSSTRLEGNARFHLDPLREAGIGLYGLGGVAVINDDFEGWEANLVVGAGLELPSTGRATWAVEAALAGGFRLSVVMRGVRGERR